MFRYAPWLFLLFLSLSAFPLSAHAKTCAQALTLREGSISTAVYDLQVLLNADVETRVSQTGVGSPGKETNYFGSKTKAAVIKFQEKYASEILVPNGLTEGTGIVGPSTRAKLASLCGQVLGATTTAEVTVPPLTIALGPLPPPTLAVQDALFVPFTNVVFTAGTEDVTVESVTLERFGPGSDQVFANVEILDEDGFYIGDAGLNANHRATIRDEFTIPANSSRTILIAGDMASDLSGHQGEMVGVRLIGVEASHPVALTEPIAGVLQRVNSTLTIGSSEAVLGVDDPRGARTRYINDTAIRFSAVRITAGSMEDLLLKSVTWSQGGTASQSDLANVATVVRGTTYPTEVDGRLYTTIFDEPLVVKRGESLELLVQGDLTTTGAQRTVRFDIEYATDLQLYGTVYGYGIYTTPADNTDVSGNSVFITSDGTTDGDVGFPFFKGSEVTISPGAVSGVGKI